MATKVILKKSSEENKVPLASQLDPGELAVNLFDRKLYTKTTTGEVVLVGTGTAGNIGFQVKNQTGSSIAKGTLVGFAGTVGASGKLLVQPFLANGTYSSDHVVGVLDSDLADGADGFAVDHGTIRNIDTSGWISGTILYASSTVPGALSSEKPQAPNNKITVAAVIYSSTTAGSIEIRISIGSSIENDELVELSELTEGDTLVYNSALNRFENQQPAGGTGGISGIVYALDGNGGNDAAYVYDANLRISSIVDEIFSKERTTTISYNLDGTINTVTVSYDNVTEVTTYTYIGGNLSGYSRSLV